VSGRHGAEHQLPGVPAHVSRPLSESGASHRAGRGDRPSCRSPLPADARAVAAPVPRRWPWAQLLRRVFGFDVLVCDRCAGPPRILGAVTEPHAVRRFSAALGFAAEPAARPPRPRRLTHGRSRSPPRRRRSRLSAAAGDASWARTLDVKSVPGSSTSLAHTVAFFDATATYANKVLNPQAEAYNIGADRQAASRELMEIPPVRRSTTGAVGLRQPNRW
jgi:hypothetical protein